MKRKIDILTYWGVPNYGAWTQAYAMNKLLTSIVGEKAIVKHIQYLEPSHWDIYYQNDERLCNSFSYSWRTIPHTDLYSEEQLERTDFDIVVFGSDSIWQLFNNKCIPDLHLIGERINARSKVAISPSFGNLHMEDILINDKCENVSNSLRSFDRISVRDDNSSFIVDKLISESPEVTVDPALMWDFENDDNVVLPLYKNYIAVYGTVWETEFINRIQAYAKDRGLKLISLGFTNNWCDINLRMVELRTLEWIGFFKGAEEVVTSTFHGLMMGLKFHKQIKFCQEANVVNRSASLVNALKIPVGAENINCCIDYEYAKASMDALINHSKRYVSEVIRELLDQ